MSIVDVMGLRASAVLPDWMGHLLDRDDVGDTPHIAEYDTSEYLMPSPLLSPGLVHICGNMVSEVDSALNWWDSFLPGYMALAHQLHHDHLRKRRVGMCVIRSRFRFSHFESLFHFSVPNLAKWRCS